MPDETVNVRYLVDDVAAAIDFYTQHFGFTVLTNAPPAFADVQRGNLRLLLSGPSSSAGRAMDDGETPAAGGWNRIHLLTTDIEAEIDRLEGEGVRFRNDVVVGPGGSQVLVMDPAGNLVEALPTGRLTSPHMTEPGSRLVRRLGTGDAVVIGLGSMIGAGVFAAIGPAAEAAGSGLLVGLALAAVVAYCNATSSAQLAAVYPSSGGTYVYGRERLGPRWGYLAGWGFVVGKTASCAAMALTFGAYAAPAATRPLAVLAVLALTVVNWFGVRKTALLTRVIVAIVLASLVVVVIATMGGGSAAAANLGSLGVGGLRGVLQSAGLLFFAFAGYARIATLGEEVRDPARTIPRAIPLALGIALAVYAVVATAALLAAGPEVLADAEAPLEAAVRAGRLDGLVPAVRVGGSVASLGVLLALIVGVSRTAFAMAANGDLPRWLDAVHPVQRVPHHAELAVGALVATVVVVTDLRGAIGFSLFAVLTYYAIANASAWTLAPEQRRWPRALAVVGLAGCTLLAFTLPWRSIVSGAAVLAIGAVIHAVLNPRGAEPGAADRR